MDRLPGDVRSAWSTASERGGAAGPAGCRGVRADAQDTSTSLASTVIEDTGAAPDENSGIFTEQQPEFGLAALRDQDVLIATEFRPWATGR